MRELFCFNIKFIKNGWILRVSKNLGYYIYIKNVGVNYVNYFFGLVCK